MIARPPNYNRRRRRRRIPCTSYLKHPKKQEFPIFPNGKMGKSKTEPNHNPSQGKHALRIFPISGSITKHIDENRDNDIYKIPFGNRLNQTLFNQTKEGKKPPLNCPDNPKYTFHYLIYPKV